MQWGTDPDGKPCLSPWINTADHRGANSEQHVYKVGQNVRMSSMNGDYAMATVTHWAPSNSAPGPDHADGESHTRQIGDNRSTNNPDYYETSQKKGEEGKMRMHKDGDKGITHRYGTDARCHINKDEVLIKFKDNTIFVNKEGCWSSSPIKTGPPKSKDDNA